MDKIIEDDELGRLLIRVNSRARSLVFRTKSDAVYVSDVYKRQRQTMNCSVCLWITFLLKQIRGCVVLEVFVRQAM